MHYVVTLIAALALVGCASNDEDVSLEPRPYVGSFYPLAWATEQVTRDSSADVVNLTPPGVEPHDIELSPSDLETIRDAKLVVYVSGGFQPAVEGALEHREGRSLDVLEDESDPHIWLDPARFARAVERIAPAVGRGGSAHGVVRELKRLDREYQRGLADCDRRTFVTTHAAFGLLARRYGLVQLSLAGSSPEAEPSPRELEELIELVRESGATTIFSEPLVADRLAKTIARDADVEVATLDPLEGLSQERLDAGDDYLSVMRANLAALREALGCR